MMRIPARFTALTLAISGITWSQAAMAQTSLNDVEGAITQGAQFDDALALVGPRPEGTEDDATIDGEAGVFILQKADIFTLGANLGGGYSSNPGRTLDTSEASAFASLALRAGVNTIVDKKYDVGLNLVASATEYDDPLGPSSRSVIVNAYVGRAIFGERLYISGSVVAGMNSDEDFNQSSLFYGASANVSYTLPVSNNVLLRPSVSAARQWSDSTEQNNISATASGDVIWLPAPKWIVSGRIAYTHRRYDNFFEDVTFVERKDDQIQAGARVSRKISENLSLSVSYDYTSQDSTFFLSGYDSHDGGLSLQISHRF
jgi:hypothetical protein